MKMKHFLLFLALLICAAAQAQNYTVERDSVGFIMLQAGEETRFDTATVKQNILQKEEQAAVLQNEIQLLERLVLLRRQLALVRDEKNTLTDILEKARQCVKN